jgi:glutamate N-acetyltransferase/amino-acid N-acetyltransferase
VLVSKRILEETGGQKVGGLVVNSGCANAVTGEKGMRDAERMSKGLNGNALVMSTGVIGQRLPIEKIMNGVKVAIDKVGETHQHWLDAATAFCTTDTFPKLLSKEIQTKTGSYRIAGIAKGAGMIHPKYSPFSRVVGNVMLVWQPCCRRYSPMRQLHLHYFEVYYLTLLNDLSMPSLLTVT